MPEDQEYRKRENIVNTTSNEGIPLQQRKQGIITGFTGDITCHTTQRQKFRDSVSSRVSNQCVMVPQTCLGSGFNHIWSYIIPLSLSVY